MSQHVNLAAFMLPGHASHSHVQWRHPRSRSDFFDIKFWQDLGRTLERGRFDMLFLGDAHAVPSMYGGSYEQTIRRGTQAATMMDPLTLLATIAGSTSNLGLTATGSTSLNAPYDLARRFSTLDHLSGGRAGWNVVTSISNADARNLGRESLPPHDERYDRADEFIELAYALWNSWGEDSLIVDKENRLFADPSRVHRVNYEGKYHFSDGPLTVPRSPQARPVTFQAGASGRGRDFAARWAECVFMINPFADGRKEYYDDIKARAEGYGRSRDDIRVLAAFMPFVGETESIAKARFEYHNSLVDPVDGLVSLSYQFGTDFSKYSVDQPLADLDIDGVQGTYAVAKALTERDNLTLGDLGRLFAQSQLVPQLVGSGKQVADKIEHMVGSGEADGVMLLAADLPGTFDDFSALVVPELQRRGLLRTEYEGNTLRSNLGLGAPTFRTPQKAVAAVS